MLPALQAIFDSTALKPEQRERDGGGFEPLLAAAIVGAQVQPEAGSPAAQADESAADLEASVIEAEEITAETGEARAEAPMPQAVETPAEGEVVRRQSGPDVVQTQAPADYDEAEGYQLAPSEVAAATPNADAFEFASVPADNPQSAQEPGEVNAGFEPAPGEEQTAAPRMDGPPDTLAGEPVPAGEPLAKAPEKPPAAEAPPAVAANAAALQAPSAGGKPVPRIEPRADAAAEVEAVGRTGNSMPSREPLVLRPETNNQAQERAFAAAAHGADADVGVRLVEQVQRAIKSIALRGGGAEVEARIALSPPSLGALRLTLRVRDGELSASVLADNAAARHLLQTHVPELREALAQQGLTLGQFNVSSDARGREHTSRPMPGARRRASQAVEVESAPQVASVVAGRVHGYM